MSIKPIKTEQDYDMAMERLEVIFDAKKGTPEGDELEALGKLIEEYELKQSGIVELTPVQIEMLKMAEEDIKAGRLISNEELKASDPDWLKE
ncbi:MULTISPECIES: hypothetical protein [Flavobacterium]|uniref:hypothetical protein n=1 Tax=Flavobacterium TaxID=237 RepID=UPI0019672930|nr:MULTISPECIES: hypothetical protein [Flavobacterium]